MTAIPIYGKTTVIFSLQPPYWAQNFNWCSVLTIWYTLLLDVLLILRIVWKMACWYDNHGTLKWASMFSSTVYPRKYAHGFCFAVLCCGYTLADFPISIRLTSLAPWQSNDCPSASKATLMNMYKYFMWIHYERLHNHNKAKHNKTVCIFLGIYCTLDYVNNCPCIFSK